MPEFLPFVGTRFSNERCKIERVVSPPYDIISDDFQADLYARDPHNIIRLERNHDSNPYDVANSILHSWLHEGILVRDTKPRFYVVAQTFPSEDGSAITRWGATGMLRLTDYDAKEILPHERTLTAPKVDRLHLLESTRTNISPIFGLTSDKTGRFDDVLHNIGRAKPTYDFEITLPDGNTVHTRQWEVNSREQCDAISMIVAAAPVIIADGHHRYETALAFHHAHPDDMNTRYIMAFISNLDAPGTAILPTHRMLHSVVGFDSDAFLSKVDAAFRLQEYPSRDHAVGVLRSAPDALCAIELAGEERGFVVTGGIGQSSHNPAPLRLEQEILMPIVGLSAELIANKRHLRYPHTLVETDEMKRLGNGDWNAVFYLNPIRPDELRLAVSAGQYLPQKSTFFYPKLLTGLVLRELDTNGIR